MQTKTRKTEQNQCREGGILLVVLLLVLVFSVLGLGLLSLGRQNAVETSRLLNRSKAFWMAEAGLHELRAIITLPVNRGLLENYGLVDAVDSPVLQGSIAGAGSYEVYVSTNLNASLTGAVRIYDVRCVGHSPGVQSTVVVSSVVRLRTGSERVWSTNNERNIRFTTGDIINGPAHTNGKYYINGKPSFLGAASSSWSDLYYNDDLRGGANSLFIDPEVFTAGLELGVPESDFNPNIISDLRSDALQFPAGDYQVVFNGNMYIARQGAGTSTTNFISSINSPDDEDNILYFPGNVEVSGEVGGRVSIASEGVIKIVGDIVYSSAPDPNHGNWSADFRPSVNEALGLFSQQKVEIDLPLPIGADVNIHAAIFVTEPSGSIQNPGFGAADRYSNLNSPYINMYGSIMQHTRGIIGTTGGSGYLKNYRSDSRFLLTPPPGAPYDPPEFSQWRASF